MTVKESDSPTLVKGNIMNISTANSARTALAIAAILAGAAAPASAGQDPGPARSSAWTASEYSSGHCPLTRVGTQFVRCDNLTGAGVPAPPWVPES